MQRVRLTDREAARVTALAVLPLLCLAPSVARLIWPAETTHPAPLCRETAARVEHRVVCDGDRTTLTPVAALWAGVKIDLNAASAEDLQIVRGIGPRLSVRIIADRDQYGPFNGLEDVRRVKGIGPKLGERMAAFVTVLRPERAAPGPDRAP